MFLILLESALQKTACEDNEASCLLTYDPIWDDTHIHIISATEISKQNDLLKDSEKRISMGYLFYFLINLCLTDENKNKKIKPAQYATVQSWQINIKKKYISFQTYAHFYNPRIYSME